MLSWISGIICPGRCSFCHESTGTSLDLCQFCVADLPTSQISCYRCAVPLRAKQASLQSADKALCVNCIKHPPPVRLSISAYLYTDPINNLVLQLKFGHVLRHARTMGLLLAQSVSAGEFDVDLAIPVPLSRYRHLHRGFNQAEELSRFTCKKLDIPLSTGTLVRDHHQLPQASLGREHRQRNIRGAFRCTGDLHNVRCVLIDDVMTTGATVFEAATVLLNAGAKSVDVWVFARTP